MVKFLVRLALIAAVVFAVASLTGERLLVVDSYLAAFGAALALAIVNAVVKPVVKLLTLPLTILTLGFF
ncbi:MAG: phage holin family protein, partial [Actinomycetota bacterium]|nr:phage holin family protein [Actinomycetota bacterium]